MKYEIQGKRIRKRIKQFTKEVYDHSEHMVERFELEELRKHSMEDRPKRMTFIVLNDLQIGFEIDWYLETIMWFLYKEKKKNMVLHSRVISLYSDYYVLKLELTDLISKYYKTIGKDQTLPTYAQYELGVYVQHLYYHVWADTLEKALAKIET